MKFYAIMLAHNRPEVIRGCMENIDQMTSPEEKNILVKQLYFCQYPLPSIDENRQKTKELCEEFNWRFEEIENKGVLANHNMVLHERSRITDDDFYFTCDPDQRQSTQGFVSATLDVFSHEPDVMFISSGWNFHKDPWMQAPPYSRKVHQTANGTKYASWGCLISWPSGTWRASFLRTRPRHFGEGVMYGNSESTDYGRLIQHKKKWVSLVDHMDNHLGAADQSYTDWKLAWAHGKTNKSFIDWLKEQGKA